MGMAAMIAPSARASPWAPSRRWVYLTWCSPDLLIASHSRGSLMLVVVPGDDHVVSGLLGVGQDVAVFLAGPADGRDVINVMAEQELP